MTKLFLASPLGFADSSKGFLEPLIFQLTHAGFEVVNPWSLASDIEQEMIEADKITDRSQYKTMMHSLSMKIAERNATNLRSCDIVLAILDGVDVDSGTASEIGYAYGLGKKIFGYRGDIRQSGENNGVQVNLQVQYWIEHSGGSIITALEEITQLRD